MGYFRPSFTAMGTHFTFIYGDGKLSSVGKKIGGKVDENIKMGEVQPSSGFTNGCAIRMSYCLNYSGVMGRNKLFRSLLLFPSRTGSFNMAIKITSVFCLFLMFFTDFCYAEPPEIKRTPIELFKGYALTTCIANGLQSGKKIKDSAAENAAAAAREYAEHDTFPIEAETQARLLGLKFLSRKYANIYGDNLIFIKCIDFYNSEKLNQLIKKYS